MAVDGARRAEILDAAAALFASTGVRTPLREIADACGILPGSLYHHFDSKDAIVVELVRRYQNDLDDVAHAALEALQQPNDRPPAEIIIGLGEAIAACAVRHRAALLLTFYEPPAGSSEELVQRAARAPIMIQAAMLEALRAGRAGGYLRAGVDLALLADRLCQSMLHVGIGVSHRQSGGHRIAAIKCRILLDGLAVDAPGDQELDQAPAFLAANKLITGWDADAGVDENDREAVVRAIARAEFGRRGYEATTIRDIAAAAGLGTGSVSRAIGSKERLLTSIMASYVAQIMAGWRAVLRAPSSAVERLDALMWFDINLMTRFSEEFKIQFAGLREAPPDSPDLAWTFPTQLRQVKSLLAAGIQTGDFHLDGASLDLRARCLFSVIWMPQNIVHSAGTQAALALSRDTVLRGAVDRSARRSDQPGRIPV
ncbi:TetR/AcrR family transcriptional regulator [Pseudofrankia inefficax]|uniref:Regulatory protein TetR n=1 Tax=Pseudofrankia inefficax (strain DSM 45817 / CECT 9037 / DDB 130130 / EuI1c) TaxID=298654 RepID=E3IUB6_PSEI1|nr:TetR/AcrR family transcriptional regulator [Pseudofrankia inefficax]ADP82453.1 regulatory protein TetR [Pseudofrankia inefficax]